MFGKNFYPVKYSCLFHVDSFGWTDVNAGLAVHAHVFIDFRFLFIHCDCRCRTFTDTCLTPGAFILVNNCHHNVHSTDIASDGQMSTQVWQSTHMSLSTFAFSFSSAIADAGHSSTQVSHPVHLLESMIATNFFTPSYMLNKR